MANTTTVHTLSDGTTLRVRRATTILGTAYHEVPSRTRKATTILRIDGHMYLILGPRNDLVPISHPTYAYAATDAEGARTALAFFVEAAEECIQHAAEEGIPVQDCYATAPGQPAPTPQP